MGCKDSKPAGEQEATKAAEVKKPAQPDASPATEDMGCASAKAPDPFAGVDVLTLLTDEDKVRVKATWDEFIKANSSSDIGFGHLIFYTMFREAPNSKFLFNFVSSVEEKDLVENQKLRWHIGRVVDAITGTVFVLDDIKGVATMLEKLGTRHFGYGTKEDFYPGLRSGVLYAIQKGLGDGFTPEKRESFDKFLKIVACSMVKGIRSAATGESVPDNVSVTV